MTNPETSTTAAPPSASIVAPGETMNQPRRWGARLVSGFVVALFILMLLGNTVEALITGQPGALLILGIALAIPIVGLMFLPPYGKQTVPGRIWFILLTFSVAGLVVLPISAVDFFQPADVVVVRGLRAPLLEESWKILAVLLLAHLSPWGTSTPLRWMWLGLAVGVAFGGIENVGSLFDLSWGVLWRRTLCVLDHGLWTALVAGSVGLAAVARSGFRFAVPVAGLTVAVGSHSFHNVVMLHLVYRSVLWWNGIETVAPGRPLRDAPGFDGFTALVWLLVDALAIGLLVMIALRTLRISRSAETPTS